MITNHKKRETKNIRILHLVRSLKMAGAEILLLHYIRSLGTERYEHYVYNFGQDGSVRELLESLDVPVIIGPKSASIKNPMRFILCLFALVKDLVDFIRNHRIQIIQSHLSHANQLAVAVGKLVGVPALPTVHSTMAFVDPRSRWDARVYLIKAVDRLIYRMADRVLVVSQEIKENIRNIFSLEDFKVLVLKNGIVFEDSSYRTVDLEKEFHISTNKLKLIAVGRLAPLKGFDILVKSVVEVVNQGLDDLLVLIVGEGEERLRLEELIKNLGVGRYVKLLGLRHDVIGLMKASDLFVMPSHYEGLSIAMIEAMACGLPIIASDAPGLRTYVDHGKNGLLFPVKDHKSLAHCILRLSNDKKLRIRLSHGARISFEREYDMRRNIKSLDILLRQYTAAN
jgi:glycosyltransferase involved in cell wall biosynthesis